MMGQAKARALHEERAEHERTENVNDRWMILAVMAAFLYPSQGDQAITTAGRILDEAKKQAEKDIPAVGAA
jgi:hypothetical protein